MNKEVMKSRRVWAWMSYDGANSIFHLIGMTILLPWALTAHWDKILERDPFASYFSSGVDAWGKTMAFAYLFAGPLAWWIGKLADKNAKRRVALIITTALTILSLIWVVSFFSSRWSLPLLLIPLLCCLAFFTISLSLYDSMLIDATGNQQRKSLAGLSTKGWALGYIVSTVVLSVLYLPPARMFTDPVGFDAITKILVVIIFLFAVMSVVVFRVWPAEILAVEGSTSKHASTCNLPLFLFGAFLLTDATVTIASFVTILATRAQLFDLSLETTVFLFLCVQVIAILATWPAGSYSTGFRPKIVCLALCGAWFVVCSVAFVLVLAEWKWTALYFLTASVGLLIGTTPSIIRSLYAEIIPLAKRGEFFAYTVLTQRTLAFIGPFAATLVLNRVDNYVCFVFVPAGLVLASALVFTRTWAPGGK